MLIKTIIDEKAGTKWEISKDGENSYSYKYYELFQSCGWRYIFGEKDYTKDCIEWEFEIKIA